MRIAVIAAQGKSGQAFVEAALAAGHQVVAGIRGSNPFGRRPGLILRQCDATDLSQVEELIVGCDAVVTMIGHVRGSRRRLQTEATTTVLEAMKRRRLTRLVSLTGTGARVKGDTPDLLDRVLNLLVTKVDPTRVQDGIAHLEVLQESGIDFTVVRVLKLTNGRGGAFDLSEHGPAKPFVARRDVALAVLDCLENNRFIGKFPVVSKHHPKR